MNSINDISSLERILKSQTSRLGFIGTRLSVIEDETDTMSAHITADWMKINMTFGKYLDLVPDLITADYVMVNTIPDALVKVGMDVLMHEAGHRALPQGTNYGCPNNVQMFDLIKSAISTALPHNKESLTGYVANAFMDVLDNINCRRFTDFTGQTLFWNNQGLKGIQAVGEKELIRKVRDENGNIQDQVVIVPDVKILPYSPFYESFVRINLELDTNSSNYMLLNRFFNPEYVEGNENPLHGQIENAVAGFLSEIKRKVSSDKIAGLQNDYKLFNRLFNQNIARREKIFSDLATAFVQNLHDFLTPKRNDYGVPEDMFGEKGSSPDSNDGSAKGSSLDKIVVRTDGVTQKPDGLTQKPDSGKKESFEGWDKLLKKPLVQEEISFSRYSSGKGQAPHRDSFEQLYHLYRRISKDIPVETTSWTASQGIPVAYFGKKEYRDPAKKLRLRGVGFDKKGKMHLKTARFPHMHPAKYKTHPTSFPTIKIVKMDRSWSMNEAAGEGWDSGDKNFIPWGDKSKYHFALKGYFGIDNYLEKQNVSDLVTSKIIGFSGEGVYQGAPRDVAKQLLVSPMGGTEYDIETVERELEIGSLVLSISDGAMYYDDELMERIQSKAHTQGIDYAHIQIGPDTDFSLALEEKGIAVYRVRGDDDLSNIMVSFVSGTFKQYANRHSSNLEAGL